MVSAREKQTRAPKQLGDFGEGLVTYALIRKGYEVAYVDHVGADLIAEKDGKRYAISVKFRLFRKGSKESRMITVNNDDIEKLENFSKQFGMIPVFAQAVSIVDDEKIHLFIISVEDLKNMLKPTKKGYSLRFGRKNILNLINDNRVEYCLWIEGCKE
jgi:Holliday junction resolvase